jgi:hypothetical protein
MQACRTNCQFILLLLKAPDDLNEQQHNEGQQANRPITGPHYVRVQGQKLAVVTAG